MAYDATIAAATKTCGKNGRSVTCLCDKISGCGTGNIKSFTPKSGLLSTSDDDNINDEGEAVGVAPTSSAANVDSGDQADLETTILNLKISLAVVSTLLAASILHTLHQSTMSMRAAGQAAQGKPATTADNANDDGVGPESYASVSEI